MPVLITTLFQQTTLPVVGERRIGGWSEQCWYSGTDTATALDIYVGGGGGLPSALRARQALLTSACSIKGLRAQGYELVDAHKLVPVGGMEPRRVAVNSGTDPTLPDVPQMSIEVIWAYQNTDAVTRSDLRGMPDVRVVGGELNLTASYQFRLTEFFRAMSVFGSVLQDFGEPQKIRTIGADRVVTGVIPVTGINALDPVIITRSTDACGRQRGHRTYVQAAAGGTVTLYEWPWGETRGGKIRLNSRGFVAHHPTKTRWSVAKIHKVGLPFDLFRGRRKRRAR